jgi:PhnB protein
MPDYHGHHYPTVCPYVFYEDGDAALAFLVNVFGLKERMRSLAPDGAVSHAEVEIGDGLVMLGCPPNHKSPAQLGHVTSGVYVHVDDVDAYYARAKAAGARVQEDPTDMPYGVRSYGVLDSEGHQWWFSQPLG